MQKIRIILCTLGLLVLSGCSTDEYFEKKIEAYSGIRERDEYVDEQELAEHASVDLVAEYFEEKEDGIRVSFAKNKNLVIEYYLDEEREVAIEGNSCTILPGQSIYAQIYIDSEVDKSIYEFSHFKIYEYKEDGKRIPREDLELLLEEGQAVYIPEDFRGKEISIEPIGAYKVYEITLSDFFVENNVKNEVDGSWFVDDKVYSDEVAEISSCAPYIVSYEYDPEEYFYLSSEPEAFYNDYEEGVVIFPQREGATEPVDYSVELHKCITAELKTDVEREVSVDGGDKKFLKANEEVVLEKLRYGESLYIETNEEWTGLDKLTELKLTNEEKISEEVYRYSFVVPERGGEFIFRPADYHYEHGTIEFKCFGNIVTSTQMLAKGSKIYYEQKTADDGYWLPNGGNYIVVGEEEETKRKLQEICFVPTVKSSISLSQPRYGGVIKYYVNGERVYTKEYDANSGTVITMEFEPWNGWICDATNGMQIVVGENKNQLVLIDGKSVDEFFREDENHKPELTVILDESVGTNMEFAIVASGVEEENLRYTEELFKKEKIVIDNATIGTERGIEISMGNRAIENGKAIKIQAEIKGYNKDDNRTCLIYSDESTKHTRTVEVYRNNSNSYSKTSYQSICIRISVVDVEKVEIPFVPDNTNLTLKNTVTGEILEEGAFIESNVDIKVSILPKEGYYISNTKEDQYHNIMKYSDYAKKIKEILQKHPAEKIYVINLDDSDGYASYLYKLDGKEVSETIHAREGQKLTLEYKITNEDYELSDASGGFLGIGKSYTEVTKSLEVTSELDNATVTKENFGISVKENHE